jgi:hypothetical protein
LYCALHQCASHGFGFTRSHDRLPIGSWILEVNTSPSLGSDTPLDRAIKVRWALGLARHICTGTLIALIRRR